MRQSSRTATAAAPTVDILSQSPLWDQQPAAEATVREAIAAAAAATSAGAGEVSVVLGDDASIRALNRDWRQIDKPTNVLSFPAAVPNATGTPRLYGDIVIAYETLARETTEEEKHFSHHLAHLTVHGFLHLLGYDHETDADAEAMEGLERTILAKLDIPDPYRAREISALNAKFVNPVRRVRSRTSGSKGALKL
jgi:probable rRNA maturation factor